MITVRQFLELVQDRLVGGPAKADERKNYPIPMISRMTDMILPSFLAKNPDALNDMCIDEEFEIPNGATSFELRKRPIAGTYSFVYASDDQGQVEVRDIGTDKQLRKLNPSVKRVVVIGNGRTTYLRFKPVGKLVLTYVPFITDMSNDDVIDLNGEGELFALLCQAIRMNEKFLNDKLNNDLVDPQNYDALRYSNSQN